MTRHLHTTDATVIYCKDHKGFLQAATVAREPGNHPHFGDVGAAHLYPDLDAARAALAGEIGLRFDGLRMEPRAIDDADPVHRIVIRRPGCTAWREMPTLDLGRARREQRIADATVPGHRIYGVRQSGLTVEM